MAAAGPVWPLAPADVALLAPLAAGPHARVHRARCRGTPVAAKVYPLAPGAPAWVPRALPPHPHLCAVLGCVPDAARGAVVVVAELCARALADVLYAPAPGTDAPPPQPPLTLCARMRTALGVARALAWLHGLAPPVVHGNLKPTNVLLRADGAPCAVADPLCHLPPPASSSNNNGPYTAPEVVRGGACTASSDAYSFGVLLWELVHRSRAVEEGSRVGAGAGSARPPLTMCPAYIAPLIARCWAEDPDARPAFAAEIVPAMEQIVLEAAIADPAARHFWVGAFGPDAPAVPWKALKHALRTSELYADLAAREQRRRRLRGRARDAACEPLFWLRCLLVNPAAGTDTVSAEAFGRLFSAFGSPTIPSSSQQERTGNGSSSGGGSSGTGQLYALGMMAGRAAGAACTGPPEDTHTVVSRLKHTLQAEWFHGDLDTETATRLLKADGREGAFLVRFSNTNPNMFTLSRLVAVAPATARHSGSSSRRRGKKTTEVSHMRIPNSPKGLFANGFYFHSMPEVIAKMAKTMRLKHPVRSYRYTATLQLWAQRKARRSTPATTHVPQPSPSPSTLAVMPPVVPASSSSSCGLSSGFSSGRSSGTASPSLFDDGATTVLGCYASDMLTPLASPGGHSAGMRGTATAMASLSPLVLHHAPPRCSGASSPSPMSSTPSSFGTAATPHSWLQRANLSQQQQQQSSRTNAELLRSHSLSSMNTQPSLAMPAGIPLMPMQPYPPPSITVSSHGTPTDTHSSTFALGTSPQPPMPFTLLL